MISLAIRALWGARLDLLWGADQLHGNDRMVLKLRRGITGAPTLKFRLVDEMIADFVRKARSCENEGSLRQAQGKLDSPTNESLGFALPEGYETMTDQDLAIWYNGNVIYPDKVRLNKYYYEHYSFLKDLEMILATVLGRKVMFGGEEI